MEPDRDRPFDNLLHDALTRQSAEAGAHLDADTAAAWADGALDAAARGLAEQHVAGCARCQAFVAALVKTAPPAPARASWFRFSRAAWLAPLTAAAAAVIVWAVMPPMSNIASPPGSGVSAGINSAGSRPAAEPPAAGSPPPADSHPLESRPTISEAPQTVTPSAGAATPHALADRDEAARERGKDKVAPEQKNALDARAQTPATAEALKKEQRADDPKGAPKLNAANEKPAEPPFATFATGGGTRLTVEEAQAKRDAAANARAGAAAGAVAAAPTSSPTSPPAAAAPQSSAGPVPMRQTMAADSFATKAAPVRREPASAIIRSPNPNQLWRLTSTAAATIVDFSTDGGRTWSVQPIGVGIVVIGGASPAANVCWLVGPRGTVTLTIDGRVWQRLTFPEMIDLINVHATDDRHATVTALDGRLFVTNDRGASWTQVAKD